MRIMEIGAQSYTVRAYCQTAEDLGQTLEKIAAIGYRSVQLSAIGPIAPEQVKALCDRNGLRIVLTHNPESDFLDHPEELIRKHLLYGCRYVGLGYLPDRYHTPEGVSRFADDFRPAAERLREAGLKMMYHNHAFEFARMPDGRTMMDHLMETMPAELMGVTADTYWLQYGGADVYGWLQRHAERLHCVHLKDYAISGFDIRMAPTGSGNLDFVRILDILRRNGVTEYALVEQDDCYGASPFDCLKQSYDYLKFLMKEKESQTNCRNGKQKEEDER